MNQYVKILFLHIGSSLCLSQENECLYKFGEYINMGMHLTKVTVNWQ